MTWLAYSHLGVAKRLTLDTQPGGALAGIPFVSQPVGRLLDGSGVLSRTTGTVVTVSKLSGTGTLSGTLTAVTVEGVFTFTDLKMDTVTGTVVLQFNAPGLVSVDSNSFNVTQPNTIIGCEVGTYAITGTAQTLTRGPYMLRQDEVGGYAITGTAATLRFSGQYANEPAGLLTPPTITATQPNPFDVLPRYYGQADGRAAGYLDAHGWLISTNGMANWSIVNDSERGNSLQLNFPAGSAGGGSPGNAVAWYLGSPYGNGLAAHGTYTKIFIGYYTKLSSSWSDANLGTKLNEIYGTGSDGFFYTNSSDRSPAYLHPGVGIAHAGESSTNVPNINNAGWSRGVWHKVEWYFELNTVGSSNGTIKTWVDGVLVTDRSDKMLIHTSRNIDQIRMEMTYGGGSNPVPVDMYVRFDDWYVKVGA